VSLKGAFDANGKLLALSADILSNIGAYSCLSDHLRCPSR